MPLLHPHLYSPSPRSSHPHIILTRIRLNHSRCRSVRILCMGLHDYAARFPDRMQKKGSLTAKHPLLPSIIYIRFLMRYLPFGVSSLFFGVFLFLDHWKFSQFILVIYEFSNYLF